MPQFKTGNKAAEKWSELDAIDAFESMLEFTQSNEDITSVQQSYIDFGMPSSTYYYLNETYPVLENIKKGINDIIISRINSGALKNKFNNAAAIWRMKQLGEKDQQYMQSDNTNKNIHRELTGEEKEAEIIEIKKQLDELSDY